MCDSVRLLFFFFFFRSSVSTDRQGSMANELLVSVRLPKEPIEVGMHHQHLRKIVEVAEIKNPDGGEPEQVQSRHAVECHSSVLERYPNITHNSAATRQRGKAATRQRCDSRVTLKPDG